MTNKNFVRRVTNGKRDILEEFITLLRKNKVPFCVIGGLGVNAYAEPVVSLDMDVVIIIDRLGDISPHLARMYKVKKYPNSVNISSPFSDLRIQIQTDPRYQSFIGRAVSRDVLGYKMPVAAIEDLLQGKIWAAQDKTRRLSKRQKDLADIMRLVETRRGLARLLPASLRKKLAI